MSNLPSFLSGIDYTSVRECCEAQPNKAVKIDRSVVGKARKAWKPQSSSSGLSGVFGLLAATGLGLIAWRTWRLWWSERRPKSQSGGQGASQAASGKKGGRSTFSFDKGKGKIPEAYEPNLVQVKKLIAPATALTQSARRSGNAKKDKSLRQERRAEKEAKKQMIREQLGQLDKVASRAAEALGGNDEGGPVRMSYVDFEKTADAFQRVHEYQETGKKRF